MKLFVALMMALGLSLAAQAKVYQIDPVHSQITFKIRHLVGKVRGQFLAFGGAIHFDEAKTGQSKVDAQIQAASISTNNDRRDGHLRSGDFFDVEKYPTITFTSSGVTTDKDGKLESVAGTLTMHGVSKPVVLKCDYLGAMKDPMGKGQRVGFEGTTTLNRKDYNIIWNKALDNGSVVLGDDVEISLNVEAAEKEK